MTMRLALAKAALETACARYDSADAERTAARQAHAVAILELNAAEAAAASLHAIPPALLEVALQVHARYINHTNTQYTTYEVYAALARSHSIDLAHLRAALEKP